MFWKFKVAEGIKIDLRGIIRDSTNNPISSGSRPNPSDARPARCRRSFDHCTIFLRAACVNPASAPKEISVILGQQISILHISSVVLQCLLQMQA